MFQPGDFVMLNGTALMENIRRNGNLFPDLTSDTVLKVRYQRNASVYIDTVSLHHSVVHFSWLRLATADEIRQETLRLSGKLVESTALHQDGEVVLE